MLKHLSLKVSNETRLFSLLRTSRCSTRSFSSSVNKNSIMAVSSRPTNWSIHVVSSLSSDTGPTLLFNFEQSNSKYIFNAGENANRAFIQSKTSWSGTKAFFLTGVGRGERDRVGGLASLLMSFADADLKNTIDIVGPPGVKHLLASMRGYMYRESLPILSTEVPSEFFTSRVEQGGPSPIFKDSNLTVYAIPVCSSSMKIADVSDANLKRKRENEVVDEGDTRPPTKKRAQETDVDPDTAMSEDPSLPSVPSLLDLLGSSEFSPETLNPAQSQEWYDLMTDIMFPQSKKARVERAMSAENKSIQDPRDARDLRRQKGKEKYHKKQEEPKEFIYKSKFTSHLSSEDGEGNVDDYRRPSLVKGFHEQLPRFTLPEVIPTSPSALALSYLAIGPRVRGKFDGAKADALGIPRQMRNRLTAGETVTFTPQKKGKGKGKQKETNKEEGEESNESITVRPEDLIAPSQPPAAALVLDIPNPDYIPSIIAAFEAEGSTWARWTKYSSSQTEEKKESLPEEEFILHTVFHLLGEGVLEDERYRSFMSGFKSEGEIHHVVSSKEHLANPVTFTSSAYQLLKLVHLDAEIFKVPKFQLIPQKDISSLSNLPKSVTPMQNFSLITMRPLGAPRREDWVEDGDKFHPATRSISSSGNFSKDLALHLSTVDGKEDSKEAEKESEKDGWVLKPHTAAAFAAGRAAAASYSSTPDGSRKISEIQGKDVSIITLGTGSAVPGKYRNVSATVIQVPNYGNILLDCGEGTWGQLCRMFGTNADNLTNVYSFLRDLKVIFVSHVHADHHMGVAKVLTMRKALDPPPEHPLYLISIRAVHLYLRELSDLEDLGLFGDEKNGVMTILSPALHWKQSNSYQTTGMWAVGGTEDWLDMEKSRWHTLSMCKSLNLKSLLTVDVRHRTRCYGCVIRSLDGWSVTFSADTVPADNLVYAANSGNNTTSVLIHEATMSDDQEIIAKKKSHSTIGQAIEIGRRMHASNVLLTHFSARQPKIPHQISQSLSNSDDFPFIVTAFDYAHLTIGSMWKMQFYMDAIEQSYQEMLKEVGEEEEAAEEEKNTMEKEGN